MKKGLVIWLTGLPSSGKTTLAEVLASTLKESDLPVEILDGDEVRRTISADLGFSAKDRREHAMRVVYLSKLLIRNGINVIVPLISPYRETRDYARRELEDFLEVYVSCPVEECIRRDVKGLYALALRGEIIEFTGVSDPYEAPESPEVTVRTDLHSIAECSQQILKVVSDRMPQAVKIVRVTG